MLGIVKAGAILVNVNFRYVEGELRYLFDNSDMVALVHERRYADRVANVLPDTPHVRTILVVEDGSDQDYRRYGGVEFYSAIAAGSPERDFGERSADAIYLLYTGGTTGFPKGVMWRHEDIYRVLFGGTDFATGEFVKDEYDLAKAAAANPPMIRYPIPPMIHGATQSATWMALFGQTTVLAPEFNADEVWRTIHKHKVNLLFFTGDAMARPLVDALVKGNDYDLSSLFLLASTAALFSPSIKEKLLELLPNRVITDSIGSSETGLAVPASLLPGRRMAAGPGCGSTIAPSCSMTTATKSSPARGCGASSPRRATFPSATTRTRRRRPRRSGRLTVCATPFRGLRPSRGGRHGHHAGSWLGVDQQRRREGLPRRGRGRFEGHPDVFDALVVGVPDPRYGQQVAAVVQARPGCRPSLAELDSFVRSEIAGYKVPRSLWFVDEVKRSPAGKPDYRWAKEQTEARPADDVHAGHVTSGG